MLHSIKSGSFEPSFFLARFASAIIEVEGPPEQKQSKGGIYYDGFQNQKVRCYGGRRGIR